MEENFYLCQWKRTPDGIRLNVKARPKIYGEGATYAEAEEKLIEAIQDAGGAMFVSLEFDKPLPKSAFEEKYTSPELYLLCGDDGFQTDGPRWSFGETVEEIDLRLKWNDEFYEKPVCRYCRRPKTRRTGKELFLRYAGRYDGAFGNIGSESSANHKIFSQGFLELLTTEERDGLQFQATTRSSGRKKFFELVGPEGPGRVNVAGLPNGGWACPVCGYKHLSYFLKETLIRTFVARADLPDPLPSVFTVGKWPEIDLCVTGGRWKELNGQKGTRGILSHPLGVVLDREVVRDPELTTLVRDTGGVEAMLARWNEEEKSPSLEE